MLALRPYQEQCLEAISDAREDGCFRQLVALPIRQLTKIVRV